MISTKTVDWKIFQGGDNFLVAINLIYLVDSTTLSVCHHKRGNRNKTFKGLAKKANQQWAGSLGLSCI